MKNLFDDTFEQTCSLKKKLNGFNSFKICKKELIQPAITCSKLTIETLEQGEKYVQS